MTIPPIAPAALPISSEWAMPRPAGGEWSVGAVAPAGAEGAGAAGAAGAGAGEGFGSMLADAVGSLQGSQDAAAEQARLLATGQTQDVTSVVTAVEEARLSMQLASQLRNKAVEAYTEIFRTQV